MNDSYLRNELKRQRKVHDFFAGLITPEEYFGNGPFDAEQEAQDHVEYAATLLEIREEAKRERLERREREREEREQTERQERERVERELAEREERQRVEREQWERKRREERERAEREERERQEAERQERNRILSMPITKVYLDIFPPSNPDDEWCGIRGPIRAGFSRCGENPNLDLDRFKELLQGKAQGGRFDVAGWCFANTPGQVDRQS